MEKDHIKKILTVGEVAKRSGVAISTLHFYESKGLIISWRTDGNQRRFHRAILRRIAIIKVAQRAGIPLSTIREALIDLPHNHVPNAKDWQRFTDSWKDMLNDKVTNLIQLRDQITSCIGCGCLSLEMCPLMNQDDSLGQQGPGPRRLISNK